MAGLGTSRGWLEITATGADAEALEDALLDAGALAVTLTDAADVPILEPELGTHPTWPSTCVTGLFGADADESQVLESVRTLIPETEIGPWSASRLEDRQWVRAWLDHYHPMTFGERLWICPTGREADIPADAVAVHLDPGLAFGTGTHSTTALCLRWLDGMACEGTSVLDMGCGSGVLAVAAARLGASRIDGVDIDPQAVQATRDNAQRNAVTVQAWLPKDAPTDSRYDIVIANILAAPLITMAPALAARLRPGGHLVLAGLLESQAEDVIAAYAPYLPLRIGAVHDGWARLQGHIDK
ncbi:50S ribosomal protein L11 methyltransferase [Abyssibacter sp.]|uniref:50S ribosomal protein L11 methyltransferase n=1 Tax=Abyssibacter sp. TaxID=2320200 RepID=UPI0025BFA1AA|nr:50S ribosomal protein L11 methyltransferase [Abyssibacter sp.]MCK5857775.1 50S ribosomal protein L11 methyltransferase [Abyssibacter sp.]